MTLIFCTKHRKETIIFETIQKRKTTSSFGGLEPRAAKSAADPNQCTKRVPGYCTGKLDGESIPSGICALPGGKFPLEQKLLSRLVVPCLRLGVDVLPPWELLAVCNGAVETEETSFTHLRGCQKGQASFVMARRR